MMKRKLLFSIVALLCSIGAWAGTDVTAWYIGNLEDIVNGGSANCSNNHKLEEGDGWWNDQEIPDSPWHAFAAPSGKNAGESWSGKPGGEGTMMGRTMVLPVGNYTLRFEAFGCTSNNGANPSTPSSAGDVVGYLGEDNVDITNTTNGGNTFHTVSFTFNVTTDNTKYDFGIKKVNGSSTADWCQIKNVTLTLNSTNLVAIPNNSNEGWTSAPVVNTWSIEGDNDKTYFLKPFLEVWKENLNLDNGTYQKSYTPTENGFYKVNAWVRLYKQSDGQTTYSGATMFAGSNSVSVCSGGTLYNNNKVYLGSHSVKIVGTQDVAFNYGFTLSSANFNWLAFKNITIEKVATLDDFADALPNSAVTAGLWYKFTTGNNSDAYTLSSNGDATITYTTDGTLTNDASVSDTWTLHAKQNVLLAPNTTYYVKSSTAVTLTKGESSVSDSYISGWTKVTSISQLQTNPDDYFFAIFSANNTGLILGASTSYSNDDNVNKKLYYKTAANPLSNLAYLFQIENYDGGFVLKSTAIGKYFNNTSGAPWNYHANATSTSSDCKITATLANGVYTLRTANSDGGAGNYIGLWYAEKSHNGYVDGEYLAGNKQESAKGSFLIYRIAKSDINTIDMTSAITNPDFSATDWKKGWTGTGNDKAKAFLNNTNGSFTGTMAEMWVPANSPMSSGNLNQTINNLPAGVYTLSAKIQAGITCKLYAAVTGQSEQYLEYNGGVANKSFRFLVNSDNEVKIGLKHDGISSPSVAVWVAVDDFQLVYEGCLPSDADKTSFSTALSSANAKVLGFEVGEYAPYENVDAINARITANALVIDNYTKDELTSATTTLTSATWTANVSEVNAVYNPTFALSTNNMKAIGWGANDGTVIGNESGDYHSRAMVGDSRLSVFNETKSALYLRYDGTNSNVATIYNYGKATGYTMPLKAAKYRVKADAGVWSEDNRQWQKGLRVAIVKKSDGTEIAGQTITTPYSSIASSSTDIISFDFEVEITTAGDYVLTVDNMADTSTGIVISNFELTKSGVPVTVGTSGYATFSCNYKLDFTGIEDVTAWVATSKGDGYIRMTQVTGSVPAATGLVLKGTKGETTIANIPVTTSASAPESNLLVACLTETTVSKAEEGSTNYVLSLQDGNAVFAPIDDVSATVGAGKAYLHVTGAGSRTLKAVFDDGVTGISNLNTTTNASQVYSLSGQRVEKPSKGLYIVNGKKIIFK